MKNLIILRNNTHDKLPNDITLKDVVILVTYVAKDDGKYFHQIFLEKAFMNRYLFPFVALICIIKHVNNI